MTEKDHDATSAREDSFLAELVPQVAEHLADQRARDFDAEAGRARFQAWLTTHTVNPEPLPPKAAWPPAPDSWDKPPAHPAGHPFSAHWIRKRWQRLIRFLRRPRAMGMAGIMPLTMPALSDIDELSDTFTIESPAMGDAFNFLIRIRCTWLIQATATEEERKRKTAEVRVLIEESRAMTRGRIEEMIRPIARRFPPYQAAEAEERLNREIVDCLNYGDVLMKVRAWVDVCDPIREALQKVWQQRLVADAETNMKKAHVEHLATLQEAWRRLLTSGLEEIGAVEKAKTGWLAPYALALAEDPKNAAAYLKDALDRRVDHTQKLLSSLSDVLSGERVEEIEFAFGSNAALRALLIHLGVPVGDRGQAQHSYRQDAHDDDSI